MTDPADDGAWLRDGTPSVEERLDQVAALADPARVVEPLPGGLTNTNCKVTTTSGTYVARLSRPSADFLSIDREAEFRNSVAAASTGIAPQVVEYVASAGVLVIEWVKGHTLEPTDLREPAVLAGIARSCRRLHASPRFVSDFNMFDMQRQYLHTARTHGFRLPDRYLDFIPAFDRVATVLSMHPAVTVPCHNDLLAANLIDDGTQTWLIDYEYSGNNDPSFELGNIWSEAALPPEHLGVLADAYLGRHDETFLARCRLQALASQYGWTLWGVIQNSVSEIDFDFWDWAIQKYVRAVATFGSPDFERLLAAAAPP
ncbi:choline/ethanolamine kinase family protein [Nakamurella panacisegetis]|uniref:choline/ethanolamine kinase family protein n=1 Tax=Nakamurella panacisegetis TaxID=1090615 RepID=UPI0018D2C6B5|nr:choline/ethanolamine kinase family protein [Nakamurella panacisegetis]